MKFSPLKIKWLRAGAVVTVTGIVILCSCVGPDRTFAGSTKGPVKDGTSILMEHVESIADPDGLINTLRQRDQSLFKIRKYTKGVEGKVNGTLSCVTADQIEVIDQEAKIPTGSSNVAFQIGLRTGSGVSCFVNGNSPTSSESLANAVAHFFEKKSDPSK